VVHDRNKATFNPQSIVPPIAKPRPKPKQTVRFDIQECITLGVPKRAGQKRKSQRRHTVLNTSATDSRMRETEEKKACPIMGSSIPFSHLLSIHRHLPRRNSNLPSNPFPRLN